MSTRRQTDGLALALFAVMRDRTEVDRKHVLEALRYGSSDPDVACGYEQSRRCASRKLTSATSPPGGGAA